MNYSRMKSSERLRLSPPVNLLSSRSEQQAALAHGQFRSGPADGQAFQPFAEACAPRLQDSLRVSSPLRRTASDAGWFRHLLIGQERSLAVLVYIARTFVSSKGGGVGRVPQLAKGKTAREA